MRIEVAHEIAAPAEIVFAVLADIPRWPEVLPVIRSLEMLTPGPVAVGTRFRETRVMHGREASEEMTVATLEPPRRLVLTAESHGARYTADHILEPAPRGTRLVLKFEGRPVTFLAKLLLPLAKLAAGGLKRQLESDLGHIAAAAERRLAGTR